MLFLKYKLGENDNENNNDDNYNENATKQDGVNGNDAQIDDRVERIK